MFLRVNFDFFLFFCVSPQFSISSPLFFLVTLLTKRIAVESWLVSYAWSGAAHLRRQIVCAKRCSFSKTYSLCVLINKIYDFTGFTILHPYYIAHYPHHIEHPIYHIVQTSYCIAHISYYIAQSYYKGILF